MSWLKLDDGFAEHEKIASLSDPLFRLHVEALCFAARNLTDGFLSPAALKALGRPSKAKLAALQDVGLWYPACSINPRAEGWTINDFLEYNPSAAATQKRREQSAKSMAALRQSRKSDQDVSGNSPATLKQPAARVRPSRSPTRTPAPSPAPTSLPVRGAAS